MAFVGRFDEPRKGMAVLLAALRLLAPTRPDLRLLVVGRGDAAALRRAAGPVRLDVLGPVDDTEKAAALASATVFCAPHTGGESFGIVLTEAMAAGAPVVASDLDAFRAVLGDPPAGELFPTADPDAAGQRRWAPSWTTRCGGPRCRPRAGAGRGVRLVAGGGGRRAGLPGRGRGRPPAAGVVMLPALCVLAGLVGAVWVLTLCREPRAAGCTACTSGSTRRRAGLDAALTDGWRPRRTSGVRLRGPASDPEDGANALSRALARLDRATLPSETRAALDDAEQLLVVARRVHNDAVRDTLGLRSCRLVRWLRLAGTAPMPAYFEMADPAPRLTYDRVSPSQD